MNREEKRAYDRKYYHEKTDKQRKNRLQKERIEKLSQVVREIKAERKCRECGFDHPDALQFHHNDPNTKEYTISDMTRQGWSLEKILIEVAKCDILCANCHSIYHAERRREKKERSEA